MHSRDPSKKKLETLFFRRVSNCMKKITHQNVYNVTVKCILMKYFEYNDILLVYCNAKLLCEYEL